MSIDALLLNGSRAVRRAKDGVECWAIFSEDRFYRYALGRRWSHGPIVAFCGLNPSTADEQDDDNTIRKEVKYARTWGFGGLLKVNLFARTGTFPEHLLNAVNPVGLDNDEAITSTAVLASKVICAWGSQPGRLGRLVAEREAQVTKFLVDYELAALKLTNDGHPRHPLYLKDELKPFVWRSRGSP